MISMAPCSESRNIAVRKFGSTHVQSTRGRRLAASHGTYMRTCLQRGDNGIAAESTGCEQRRCRRTLVLLRTAKQAVSGVPR